MKIKRKTWIKSAAGKISLILVILSLVLLVIGCSSWGNLSQNVASNVNNILIGLATNLLGIIVTVSFVQYFIDRQDEEQKMHEEIETIKRYDRLMDILIDRYVMYFNCVVTPTEKRVKSNPLELKSDFSFHDMSDMYEQSLYTCEGLFEPSITLFYNAEEKLRNYMIRMLENIQFKYNKELKECIMCFIEKSMDYDMRGAILGNINVSAGNEKMTKLIQRSIKDSSYNWVEKVHKNEVVGNLILPYVQLYDLMKVEIDLIMEYKEYLKKLY